MSRERDRNAKVGRPEALVAPLPNDLADAQYEILVLRSKLISERENFPEILGRQIFQIKDLKADVKGRLWELQRLEDKYAELKKDFERLQKAIACE